MKRTLLTAQGLGGCHVTTGALLLATALLSSQAFAERKYSDWGSPVNLGCGTINSASDDQGPAVSKKGLSLYFGSTRASPDASGGFDLYVAQRASRGAPWSAAIGRSAGEDLD